MLELIPGRLRLNNPVLAASGTLGYGLELAGRLDLHTFGGIVCKGITAQPRAGHPPPRIVETAAGALNAIGLANVGVDAVVRDKAPLWQRMPTPIIVNVNGESVEDYVAVAERLRDVRGVAALELNISCPNMERGGMTFGADPAAAAQVTQAVRGANDKPLIVKLTPNAGDVPGVAAAVVDAGAEAVSLVNTFPGMTVDWRRRRPALANRTGGLSGPAIKPLALRLVFDVAARVDVPVIGMGGIMRGEDALEFLMAGAHAVAVGTANLVDPFAVPRIASELRGLLDELGVTDVREVIGAANPATGRVCAL